MNGMKLRAWPLAVSGVQLTLRKGTMPRLRCGPALPSTSTAIMAPAGAAVQLTWPDDNALPSATPRLPQIEQIASRHEIGDGVAAAVAEVSRA